MAFVKASGFLLIILACLPADQLLLAQQGAVNAHDVEIPTRFASGVADKSISVRFGSVHFRGDVQDATALRGTETPAAPGADLSYRSLLHREIGSNTAILLYLDVSAGYRVLRASHELYSFRTTALPLSCSLGAELYLLPLFRPVISIGGGLIPYSLSVLSPNGSVQGVGRQTGSGNGVCLWFPLGVGARCSIFSDVDIFFMVERSVTMSDRLDGVISKHIDWQNDNFEMLSIGISWRLSSIAQLRLESPHSEKRTPFQSFDQQPPFSDASDVIIDSDEDGISDRYEIELFGTNAYSPDTDGDGLNDFEETSVHKTWPLIADCDGDGLSDGEEITRGCHPRNTDTDGDGIADASDRCPTEAENMNGCADEDGCPDSCASEVKISIPKSGAVVLAGVVFENESSEIAPHSLPVLDSLAANLRKTGGYTCTITGHTDSTMEFNRGLTLSWERALAVKKHLMGRGVDGALLRVDGRSSLNPRAPNTTPVGRSANRRIELFFVASDH
jgi:outer membrane protein OmpA-like peptidoglycan-associated protein